MLTRLRTSPQQRDEGFTLVELLVVVIIIGILAAIAIPTFLNQREKAWERAAQSDLRNAATVLESHYGDAGTYAPGTTLTAASFKVSEGVVLTLHGGAASSYCLQADHSKLDADHTYKLESATGRPVVGTCTGAAQVTAS